MAFSWINYSDNLVDNQSTVNIGSSHAAGSNGSFAAGTVLVAQLVWQSPSATVTPPSGWTQIGSTHVDLNNYSVAYFWHVCSGSESGSFAFVLSAAEYYSWVLAAYTGINNSSPVDAFTIANFPDTASSAAVGSVTTTQANDEMVFLAYMHADTAQVLLPPSDMTSRLASTYQNSNLFIAACGDEVIPSAESYSSTATIEAFKDGTYALIAFASAAASQPLLVLSDYMLDNGLQVFPNLCDRIYVCSGALTNFASVTSSALGYAALGAGVAFGAIATGVPDGRTVSSEAFSNGTVTANGNAVTWAAVDFADSEILAWGYLASPTELISGQLFGLPSITIHEYQWLSGGSNIGIGAAPLASGADALGTPAINQTQVMSAPALASHSAIVGVPVINIPTTYADGLSGAPSGSPQFLNLLNQYGSFRPPWNVAGIDYPVGPMPGVTQLDASVQANLPANATAVPASKMVNITGPCNFGSPTQGYKLPSDWQIHVTSAATGNVTIQNTSIVTTTTSLQGILCDGNVNLTILNCDIYGSNYTAGSNPDLLAGIQYNGNGTFTAHYNYLHGLPIDAFQLSSGNQTFDIRFNLIYGIGYTPGNNGGHPDNFQIISGSITGVWAFNTSIQPTAAVTDQNPILDIEAQVGGTPHNVIYANNTVIAQGTTGGSSGSTTPASICVGSFVDDTTSTLEGFQFIHNYIDPTGSIWGVYGTPGQCAGTSGFPLIYRGNHCMASFNDGNGDVFPAGACDPVNVGFVPAGTTTVNTGISNYDISSVVANPASGNVGVGASVAITISYARPVTAVGASLSLSNGATATYVGGSGTDSLNFNYTVQSSDGSVSNLTITALNGTLTDQFGNPMDPTGGNATFTGLTINGSIVAASAVSLASKAAGLGTPTLSQNGSGVGFDDTTAMPSLSIRPVYNTSTGVLTWTGPTAGGVSTTADQQQSATLTTSAAITTTAAGQVIQDLYVKGNPAITVAHNNVTIRRCFLQSSPANVDSSVTVNVNTGVTGTIIEDCYLDGQGTSNDTNGVSNNSTWAVNSVTVRRCHFHGYGQCIRFTLSNIVFRENYCEQIAGPDSDYCEMYPNGGLVNNILIQQNYMTGPDDSVHGGDSACNMTTGSGLPLGNIGPNIVIDGNWFVRTEATQSDAWQFHFIVTDRSSGGSLEWTCTNNGFFSAKAGANYFDFGSGSATSGDGGLCHHSGNYVMSNATSKTGTALD